MTYVRDMKSVELIEHMRKLQKMPGWSDPLADSLFRELEDLELRRSALWNACSEWAEKTDWARPFQPKELGKHICDVIKDRFEALKTENEQSSNHCVIVGNLLERVVAERDQLKAENEALKKACESDGQ